MAEADWGNCLIEDNVKSQKCTRKHAYRIKFYSEVIAYHVWDTFGTVSNRASQVLLWRRPPMRIGMILGDLHFCCSAGWVTQFYLYALYCFHESCWYELAMRRHISLTLAYHNTFRVSSKEKKNFVGLVWVTNHTAVLHASTQQCCIVSSTIIEKRWHSPNHEWKTLGSLSTRLLYPQVNMSRTGLRSIMMIPLLLLCNPAFF